MLKLFTDIRFFRYYIVVVGIGYFFQFISNSDIFQDGIYHVVYWFVTLIGTAIWYKFKLIDEFIRDYHLINQLLNDAKSASVKNLIDNDEVKKNERGRNENKNETE